nr:phage terminase small subunit P27 family [uncultured Janthinobacterium sp.]
MGGIANVAGRGRKPKPVARKLAAGNPGKRALNTNEPDFGLATNIDPPEWITGEARDMWVRVAPPLLKQKVLQVTDLHNLEAFCTAYGTWRAASKHVAENGIVVAGATGGPIKNPALTALNEAGRQMVTFGSLLGLDPASRQRLIAPAKGKGSNPWLEAVGG